MQSQSRSRLYTLNKDTLELTEEPVSTFRFAQARTGTVIDQKYEILGLLGEGGMGAVYKARHLLLGKEVALKTFRSASLSNETTIRFQREAQALARLSHPNIITIFDFGFCEGTPFYTMEYVKGRSLAEQIENDGPLCSEEAIALFVKLCSALALAHRKGIIHRDLKPENIFLVEDPTASEAEQAKIMDFGIASLTDSADTQKLTRDDMVFGSPLYMSPEQATGRMATARSDIYSLGCALFETLTGSPPFMGDTAMDTIALHNSARPPSLEEASGGKHFPASLKKAIAKMLAKSPEDRQPDMEKVAADLMLTLRSATSRRTVEGAGEGDKDWGSRKRILAAVLALFLVLATAAGSAVFYLSSQASDTSLTAVGKPVQLAGMNSDPAMLEEYRKPSEHEVQLGEKLKELSDVDNPIALIKLGQLEEAHRCLQAKIRTATSIAPNGSKELADLKSTVAFCYLAQNKPWQARSPLNASQAFYRKAHLDNTHQFAYLLLLESLCEKKEHNEARAETLIKQSLAIDEKVLGKDDPLVAESLVQLGFSYKAQGKTALSEQVFRRALKIYDHTPENPNIPRAEAISTIRKYLNGQN